MSGAEPAAKAAFRAQWAHKLGSPIPWVNYQDGFSAGVDYTTAARDTAWASILLSVLEDHQYSTLFYSCACELEVNKREWREHILAVCQERLVELEKGG